MTWTELIEWMRATVASGQKASIEDVMGRVVLCATTTEAAHAAKIDELSRRLDSLARMVDDHVIYHPSEDQPLP